MFSSNVSRVSFGGLRSFFLYADLSRHRGEREMFLVFLDSEFEQGLEMLSVTLAFSYIILLRIAGAPWTLCLSSMNPKP